jgi:NitT/TauT family transport system substrate-binding protein
VQKKTLAIPAAIALVLALAACSTGTQGSGKTSPSAATVTSITIGTAPAIANASLYYAISGGPFKANGLKGTPKVTTSGQQSIPLLLNGQLQFAITDPVGAIDAIASKLPIVIVAPGNYPGAGTADITGLLVNPSIQNVSDLSGKTVAVNAIGGYLQIALEAAVDAKGGDASSIKFVAMAIPDMAAAVKAGKIDGAVVAEPFLHTGVASGLKDLTSVAGTALPKVPQLVYIASKSYAQSHPDIVKKFAESLVSAGTYLNANPAKLRSVAVGSTGAPAAVLATSALPIFATKEITTSQLDQVQTLMLKYKVLSKKVNVSALLSSSN